jgi:2,4-dienoyl-CoA reductase-like NADH-dependent reductase (Old Yellow Enzyme family)
MLKLITPLINSKLKLHNRLVMPPMATAKADENGNITDAILNYYNEKSRGGNISLVIVEHSYVDTNGRVRDRQISAADDSVIESLKRLSDVVHGNGSKIAMQINHAGSATLKSVGSEIVGPSAVPHPTAKTVPTALTISQIQKIIGMFQAAAVRAQKAGFDAVEIHSAHGYLLNQFYSPLTNRRTDEYGGSLHNRIHIHVEIIQAIRHAVGQDFNIMLRLGGCDYMPGGSTVEDSVGAASEFGKAGVDILDISGGLCGYINPNTAKAGYFSDVSSSIKQAVSIPVILTGGITTAQQAEELLYCGAADLIGVGRAILNDSDWAAKAMKTFM